MMHTKANALFRNQTSNKLNYSHKVDNAASVHEKTLKKENDAKSHISISRRKTWLAFENVIIARVYGAYKPSQRVNLHKIPTHGV